MEYTQIRYEVNGGIGVATLYRPDELNAFTPVMEAELVSVFREADQDDAVRVVVVTGAGKVFCAPISSPPSSTTTLSLPHASSPAPLHRCLRP
jgi:1,4-dihydroxy-2-naphthoyl-CoA synthase